MKPIVINDPLVSVETDAYTNRPNALVFKAARQDYDSKPIHLYDLAGSEKRYGERVIEMLLAGDRGHYGCLEHPSITFGAHYFPHDVIVQARTHRHLTFDVQSFRYTGSNLLSVKTKEDLEKVVYLRPPGEYTARDGKRYEYTVDERNADLELSMLRVQEYQRKYSMGFSEEHCRQGYVHSYRQHFTVSGSLRTWFHFLDLRLKPDSQLEIQWFAALVFERLQEWTPTLAEWYKNKRLGKGKLAP